MQGVDAVDPLNLEYETKIKLKAIQVSSLARSPKEVISIPLSIDHKPDRSDERERIEQAGGFIIWA
ncbi:probable protein phosphatase 2C 11, partial [Tanacetum coccineum]